MKEVAVGGFKTFRTVNLRSKTKNVAEGRKCTKTHAELESLLDEDSCQTEEALALTLGVTQPSISHRLKSLRMIQKQGNWVPYELTPTNVERLASTISLVKWCLAGINERVLCIVWSLVMKNEFTTITQIRKNLGDHLAMLQH